MPHDVIMPALGMAQDEGLIVAWLKAPGEAVKAGDALMEVETDKATMEVEAAVDGFLSDVRAGEGESVPVGRIVAVIAETAEAIRLSGAEAADAGGAAPETGAASPQAGAAAPGEALPEGHSVVMPALGMAQDSGVVVGWLKAPGEAVAEGEPLLEVETDKATMEVPAERGGYLAAILAEEGDDVPVGETIAILSASEPASTIRRARAAGGAETGAAAPAAAPARAEAKPEGSAPTPEAAPPGRAQERP